MATYTELIELADTERDTGSTSRSESYWLEEALREADTDSQCKSVCRRLAELERDTGSTSRSEGYWLEEAARY